VAGAALVTAEPALEALHHAVLCCRFDGFRTNDSFIVLNLSTRAACLSKTMRPAAAMASVPGSSGAVAGSSSQLRPALLVAPPVAANHAAMAYGHGLVAFGRGRHVVVVEPGHGSSAAAYSGLGDGDSAASMRVVQTLGNDGGDASRGHRGAVRCLRGNCMHATCHLPYVADCRLVRLRCGVHGRLFASRGRQYRT